MELEILKINGVEIAELRTNERIINTVEDALDLIGNSGYLGAQKIILKEENLAEAFFDLKTKLAGEILQKFSNYNVQLGVVGSFDNPKSKSLRDFIYESNKAGKIIFTDDIDKARELLSR